jgi:hypothetical protein
MAQEPDGSSPHSQKFATGPIQSQSNTIDTTPASLPKVYSESILPSTPCSSERSLSFGLSYQNLVNFFSSPMRATCPAHLILIDLICLMILRDENKLWSSSLCNFLHSHVTSSLLGGKFQIFGYNTTDQNCMNKEIKSRLNSENAYYHSVQSLLSSHLLSRNVNVKIYKTIILPDVLCGCETWSLTLKDK